ncbi:MAG: DUF5916 domain-containing protein [bacterium]
MGLLSLFANVWAVKRTLQARQTVTPPRIDGEIEALWAVADSAFGFTQQRPEAGSKASENTTAYLLYDEDNLYVAFRCAVSDLSRVYDRLSEDGDGVRFFLDTFADQTTCYEFGVGFNGRESGYRITGDGSVFEVWDGVWWSAVKRFPWGVGVEIAIPFNTLRYNKNSPVWGIDFGRRFVVRDEMSFWAEQDRTGFKVSRMGWLNGIKPPRPGLRLELYPVGLVRLEKSGQEQMGWKDDFQSALGFDGEYSPTPSAKLQLTVLPDFAQIEADRYQVNLSRYELWLSERRPFFTEAVETFGGTTQPIKLFYSRRIGRPLQNGAVVPILGGVKYTDRFARGQFGFLAAVTGECEDEPQSLFSVFGLRRQMLGNSEIGLIYAGKDNNTSSNHGGAIDGIYRRGGLNSRFFLAGSQWGDSLAWALSSEVGFRSRSFVTEFYYRQIQPDFNMNGPGYTTWRGQYLSGYAGPVFYNRGVLVSGAVKPGFELQRQWGDSGFTGVMFVNGSGQFSNNYYTGVWVGSGRHRDMGRWFYQAYAGGHLSTDESKPVCLTLWFNYETQSANYRRGIIAPFAQGGTIFKVRFGGRMSATLESSFTAEADSFGQFKLPHDITFIVRPGTEYSFSPKASLFLSGEMVRGYDVRSEQFGRTSSLFALYTWRFRPRSTFYFAVNWGREATGEVKLIQVAKVRYLFSI